MFRAIRNNRILRFFWGVFALFLLNVSIDSPDTYHQTVHEDLAFNDQETIIELVVEKILGYEDAFPEYDDTDSENEEKKAGFKIEVISASDLALFSFVEAVNDRKEFHLLKENLLTGYAQFEGPPPRS